MSCCHSSAFLSAPSPLPRLTEIDPPHRDGPESCPLAGPRLAESVRRRWPKLTRSQRARLVKALGMLTAVSCGIDAVEIAVAHDLPTAASVGLLDEARRLALLLHSEGDDR